jgi:2-haloacid dehalogenase
MGVAAAGRAPEIDAVVFDLGNVLVQWDPRFLYRQLLASDDEVERFLAEVCTPEWNEAQDRGRPFAEGIAEAIGRHPHHEPLIRAFYDRWDEMCPGLVDGTVDVLAELRAARIPLYALSNWSLETFARVRHRFVFLDWFDGLVISAAERIVKPDPAIFEVLLARYGLAAGRTVFVDDAPRNVSAAAGLGFVALPFTGAARLRADLAALGLPVAVTA